MLMPVGNQNLKRRCVINRLLTGMGTFAYERALHDGYNSDFLIPLSNTWNRLEQIIVRLAYIPSIFSTSIFQTKNT
jgi:hypothetical protein